ncbi:hypothetical protein E3O44_10885 [Cryobacterium algoricola]|uniref:Uncharacterized protein n=1 Tax=Cryobacterium algoricola TaxID=1259183 RepID=A0ABY2IDP1_9MICO|nr:hypothetical protein [Cryobacterium algoricola]TFB87588.1 hypothetical protein E3O44_10885 [Cryobacterium algoricola]
MMTELENWTLIEGLDDWVGLAFIDARTRRMAPSADDGQREQQVASVASSLVSQGLMDAGTVQEHVGFVAWEGPREGWSDRIRAEIESGDIDSWGWGIWLTLTEAGEQVAAELLPTRDAT